MRCTGENFSLSAYAAYKPSGLRWLGNVPEHWDVCAVKQRFEIQLGKMLQAAPHAANDKEVPYLKAVHVQWFTVCDSDTPTMWASPRDAEQFGIRKGDLLICEGGEGGRSGIVSSDVSGYIIQNALHRVRPKALGTNEYLQYVMFVATAYGWLDAINNRATIAHFTREKLAAFRLPLPPLAEQRAIVRYLDLAGRRIRRYIAAKRKLIALLEEEKQAIIDRAVTRGLDPNVRLEPSGVEWLGDVPKHWEWCRLRNLVSVVTTGSRGWSSYASDTGPLFIRVANLSRGSLQLRFDDTVRLNLPDTSEANRTRIQAGDLLVSVTAYIGSVGIAPEDFEEAYVSQHVARCQLRPGSSSRWPGYVLLSTVGQTHGRISLYGGTKDGLSLDDVKNYHILLPPLDEQTAITEHLDKATTDVDSAIARAQRQIELVEEYRTRLIADVVTGKLDVREAVARLPEEAVTGSIH